MEEHLTRLKNYSDNCIRTIKDYDWKFKTFGEQELERMLKAVKTFAYHYMMHLAEPDKPTHQPRWLALVGKSEVGKTFLLARFFQFFQQHICHSWVPRLAASEPHFIASTVHMETSFELTSNAMNDYGYLNYVQRSNMIIIDELQPNCTEVKREKLIEMLGKMDSDSIRKWKWGLFSSNLDMKEIGEQFGKKIASRFRRENNVIVEIENTKPFFDR